MTTPSRFAGYAARLRAFMEGALTGAGLDGMGPSSGFEGAFARLALELFALQFDWNPSYRKLCDARAISRDAIHDWRDIPAAPTRAFKELDLTSLPPSERAVVFHSSGTTGHRPSRHFHDAESLAIYEASLLPWFQRHVCPDAATAGSRVANPSDGKPVVIVLTPRPADTPHSSLVHMFEAVRRNFGSRDSTFVGAVEGNDAWVVDFAGFDQALELAKSGQRTVILLGAAFNFVHLFDGRAAIRFPLPPGSCVLETGGYKGRSRAVPKAELHELTMRRLGVPASRIVCEYGMSELSSQAYDRIAGDADDSISGRRVFRFPPWVRSQIVSPESGREVPEGEPGLLRVFDLANVRSVLAVQTEDLAIRRGNGFELIGRAVDAEPRGCSLMSAQ